MVGSAGGTPVVVRLPLPLDRRDVDELLYAAVEEPRLDALQVDVGQVGEDRVRAGRTGDDGEHHYLEPVHQSRGEERPVHRDAAVTAQRQGDSTFRRGTASRASSASVVDPGER